MIVIEFELTPRRLTSSTSSSRERVSRGRSSSGSGVGERGVIVMIWRASGSKSGEFETEIRHSSDVLRDLYFQLKVMKGSERGSMYVQSQNWVLLLARDVPYLAFYQLET